MKKNSKNYEQKITNIAKTQISEAIKISFYYLKIMFFFFKFFYTNSAYIILNEKISSIEQHLKVIGICYYAIVLKEEEKKQKHITRITFIIVNDEIK